MPETKTGWTNELPESQGWYWARSGSLGLPVAVEFFPALMDRRQPMVRYPGKNGFMVAVAEDAKPVRHAISSLGKRLRMDTKPTPETSITVESCLAELREIFSGQDCSIEFWSSGRVHIDIWQPEDGGIPRKDNYFDSDSLSDCMAQVRRWKESHD